jgi:antigen flippase
MITAIRGVFSSKRGVGAIAQTILARYAITAINVITGIITARILNTEGRGEQSAMIVWPTLLAYFLTLGFPAALRYCVRREPDRQSELFTAALLTAVVTSLFAFVIGVIFMPLWLHNYPIDVIRAAQFLMIFSPEVMLGLIFTAMLETQGDFKTANTSRYFTAVLTLVALIVLALSHTMTAFSAALSYTVPPVIIAFWVGWRLRSYVTTRFFDLRPSLRILSSYGIRSYGIDLLSTISAQVDQVFVISFLSASDVGIYVVALNASRMISILHGAVVTVVFPSASALERDAVVEMVSRSARLSTLIACGFGIGLAAILPVAVPLLYGSDFSRAIAVGQLLTLEAIIGGLVYVLAQAFMALGRPGTVTFFQGCGLAIVFPAMFVFVPRFGLVGAALALLTSTVARLGLVLAAYPYTLGVPLPSFIPTREDFRALYGVLRPKKRGDGTSTPLV